MRYVLHITGLFAWRTGHGDLEPESLATHGFVHASPDEATVLAVANTLYRDTREPLGVLVVDTGRLDAEVRWEPPYPVPPAGLGPEALFPHIYGPIRRDAVIGVRYLRREPPGVFTRMIQRSVTAERLDLLPHPEGGWYGPIWRSGVECEPPGYSGRRRAAAAIDFLLEPGDSCRWHRLRSDELWVFNRGGPTEVRMGGTGDAPEEEARLTLGPYLEAGQVVQALVPGGMWQTARPITGQETLVTCVTSPAFDFDDFEVASEGGALRFPAL